MSDLNWLRVGGSASGARGLRGSAVASTFTLVRESDLSTDQLFDASLSIDAHVASMARSQERAIAGVTSGSIGLGETVTWRARHFGVWFTMTSRVTEMDRPHRFVDERVHGPFRAFRHVHTFNQVGDRTRMTDTLTVGSPAPLSGSATS